MHRFFTLKHGSRIFFKHGVSGKRMPWSHDEQLFQRWRDGKTGMPLVDANMRELKQTGVPCLCIGRCASVRTQGTHALTRCCRTAMYCAGQGCIKLEGTAPCGASGGDNQG